MSSTLYKRLLLVLALILPQAVLKAQNAFYDAQLLATIELRELNRIRNLSLLPKESNLFDDITRRELKYNNPPGSDDCGYSLFCQYNQQVEALIERTKQDSTFEITFDEVWNKLRRVRFNGTRNRDNQASHDTLLQYRSILEKVLEENGAYTDTSGIWNDYWIYWIQGAEQQLSQKAFAALDLPTQAYINLTNQEARYLDALIAFLESPWDANPEFAARMNDLPLLTSIRQKYVDFLDQAFRESQPDPGLTTTIRLGDLVIDGVLGNKEGALNPPSLPRSVGVGAIASPAFEAQLIEALGTFIADRFKEDVTRTYLDKFKARLARIPELVALLPNTWELFKTEDPFQYASLGQAWKTSFEQDLKAMPINFRNLVLEAKPDSRWYRLKNTRSFAFIDLGIEIADQVTLGRHPAEMIQHLEDRYDTLLAPNRTSLVEQNIFRLAKFLNLMQANLRDTVQAPISSDYIWINFQDLQQLNDVREMELFSALIYQQAPQFLDQLLRKLPPELNLFSPKLWENTQNAKQQFERFRKRLQDFITLMKDIEENIATLKASLATSNYSAAENFERYTEALLDWVKDFQGLYTEIFRQPPLLPEKFFTTAEYALNTYESIVEKDYHMVVTNISRLLRELVQNVDVPERYRSLLDLSLELADNNIAIQQAIEQLDLRSGEKILAKLPGMLLIDGFTTPEIEAELFSVLDTNALPPLLRKESREAVAMIAREVSRLQQGLQEELGNIPEVKSTAYFLEDFWNEGGVKEVLDSLKGEALAFKAEMVRLLPKLLLTPNWQSQVQAQLETALQSFKGPGEEALLSASAMQTLVQAVQSIHDKLHGFLDQNVSFYNVLTLVPEFLQDSSLAEVRRALGEKWSNLERYFKQNLAALLLGSQFDQPAFRQDLQDLKLGLDAGQLSYVAGLVQRLHDDFHQFLGKSPQLAALATAVPEVLNQSEFTLLKSLFANRRTWESFWTALRDLIPDLLLEETLSPERVNAFVEQVQAANTPQLKQLIGEFVVKLQGQVQAALASIPFVAIVQDISQTMQHLNRDFAEIVANYRDNWDRDALTTLPVLVLNPNFDRDRAEQFACAILEEKASLKDSLQNTLVFYLALLHGKVQESLQYIPTVNQLKDLIAEGLESSDLLARVWRNLQQYGIELERILVQEVGPQLLHPAWDSAKVATNLSSLFLPGEPGVKLMNKIQVATVTQVLGQVHDKVHAIILFGEKKINFTRRIVDKFIKDQSVFQFLELNLGDAWPPLEETIQEETLHFLIAHVARGDKDKNAGEDYVDFLLSLQNPLDGQPLIDPGLKTLLDRDGQFKRKLDNLIADAASLLLNEEVSQSFEQKIIFDLIKYGTFVVEIVNAEDAEEMKNAIKQVVLPPGSFMTKRASIFSVTLTAKPGLTLGGETQLDLSPVGLSGPVAVNAGITAPLGLDFQWGIRTKNKRRSVVSEPVLTLKTRKESYKTVRKQGDIVVKTDKDGDPKLRRSNKFRQRFLNGSSIGFYVGMIDLGAIFNVRLFQADGDSTETFPSDLRFFHVLSPSVFIDWAPRKSPVAFGIGGQVTPQLRTIGTDSNGNLGASSLKENSLRFGFRVTWDLPLVNIWVRQEKLRPYKSWLGR